MAIPQLDVQCCDKYPKVRKNSRFLEAIVTGFHSTGGLPLKLARWFAIITCKHTTINEKWWKDGGIATPLKRTGSQ